MERRVLLAITLSFLVLFLFQRFVMPPPAPLPGNQTPTAATAGAPAAAAATNATGSPASPVSPASSAAPASPAATVTEANARDIVIETSKVRATISNRGAVI